MRALKFIAAVPVFLLGGIFLLGAIADEKHLLYLVLALLCIATGVLLLRKKKHEDLPVEPMISEPVPVPEPEEKLSREELQARIWATAAAMVPKNDSEKTGAHDYEYTQVGLFRPSDIDGELPRVGQDVFFVEEPSNAYDVDAILAATSSGLPVGYLNKGKIRNAIRRALENGDIIDAQISHTEPKLMCYIAIDRGE